MEEDVDDLARGLIDGTVSCEGCPSLKDLIEQVKAGQMNFEEFKTILRTNKEKLLTQTV